MFKVIGQLLKEKVEQNVDEEQGGFRKNVHTRNAKLILRRIMERAI